MSQVERVTDAMNRILWDNLLRDFLHGLFASVPVLGWPVISDLILMFFDKFVMMRLFNVLATWGVFTSIDWKNDEIYSAYKAEAIKLVAMQDRPDWPDVERKAFKDAARKLVHFNISSSV